MLIKKTTLVNMTAVLLLSVLVAFTLTPLFLMIYTSLKPTGTLTKEIRELSLVPQKDAPGLWHLRLNQDIRSFSNLFISAQGLGAKDRFDITLYDIEGKSCAAASGEYPKNGKVLEVPLNKFDLDSLDRGLPEKIVEKIILRLRETNNDVSLNSITLMTKKFTLENYRDALTSGNFGRYFFNSLFIAAIITLSNLFFCTIAGYAFARKEFAFKKSLFLLTIGSLMIPPQVFVVPIFILMKNLGWLNTYWALILPSLVQPFGIFFMTQYISGLPVSLEDQARVDGATESQIIFKIIFPLSRPAMAIIGINTFMGAWNTFLFPFILTNTPQMRTLPVGLALFKNMQGADWTHLMAGSSLTALPVIIVFLLFQKHIIAGLTTGLVKR